MDADGESRDPGAENKSPEVSRTLKIMDDARNKRNSEG